MKTEYVPRVNQLDALQLDEDIGRIIREQLTKALQHLSPGLLSRYQPELDLILRCAVWQYSVRSQLATFGQQLLFICYDADQLTKSKLALHFILNVFMQYLRDCATFRWTHVQWLQTSATWSDNMLILMNFLNFFRFLKTGKKPSLIDWVLRLDHISMYGNKRRDVGYSHMTRELIWGGFMELLGFTLPLINYHSVKRKLRNIITFSKEQVGLPIEQRKPILTLASKCGYCVERPTLPYHMGCSHVFCYYCLQGNKMADSNFQCPICDWNGSMVEPV